MAKSLYNFQCYMISFFLLVLGTLSLRVIIILLTLTCNVCFRKILILLYEILSAFIDSKYILRLCIFTIYYYVSFLLDFFFYFFNIFIFFFFFDIFFFILFLLFLFLFSILFSFLEIFFL